MSSVEAKAMAAMRGLLRYLSGGRARLAGGTEGTGPATVGLERDGEATRRFPEEVLRAAAARGLVVRQGGFLALDASGRAWLRRAMCGEDPFAAQHGTREEEEREVGGKRRRVRVNLDESPLASLGRLKRRDGTPFLDPALIEAGERLRSDFARGQLQPRVSANWEASVSSGSARGANGIADLSDAAVGARMRVEHALRAVGPELGGVLVDVCCFLKGLETVEREREWPVRSAKLMLRTALAALDRHYNPERSEAERARDRRSHRWGAEDYRPSLRRS